MVPGAAGFLLQHHGQGMHHNTTCYSFARATYYGATNSSTHTTAHTTTHAATHATAHIATYSSSAVWSCGPIQLRRG